MHQFSKTPAQITNPPVNPSDLAASLVSLLLGFLSAVRRHPELSDLARAWPSLPESVRAGLLVMVRQDGKR